MSTALITGASSGIGAAFARAFARRGWSLVLVARDERRLEEAARTFQKLGAPHVEVLAADLSDREQVARVRERVADREHPVRVLVNNAGYTLVGDTEAAEDGESHALFETNFWGMVNITKHAL